MTNHKRRRINSHPADVPDFTDHNPTIEPWHICSRLIQPTTSKEWGPPPLAATRSIWETEVTLNNEDLIRTYHPAFAGTGVDDVAILTERNGRRIWAIYRSTKCCLYTHVAGLEIHHLPDPQRKFWNYMLALPCRPNLIQHVINPRRLLSQADLDALRAMFPLSCGLRVWIGGAIQILYTSKKMLRESLRGGVAHHIPGHDLFWDILCVRPSAISVQPGEAVTSSPTTEPQSLPLPTCCLGLRLRLPNGEPALTTVTHGFVRHPRAQADKTYLELVLDLFWAMKDDILKFRVPSRQRPFERPYVRPSEVPTSNHAIGQGVWLAATNERVGTIGYTFDAPSQHLPYPARYGHDLSLVTKMHRDDAELSHMTCPPGLPVIEDWATVNPLDGDPLFVTSSYIRPSHQGALLQGSILGTQSQNRFVHDLRKAIAEGTQYLWDSDFATPSVSLLWRCIPPNELTADSDQKKAAFEIAKYKSAQGFSRSVLCSGQPTDKVTKAILFQNFEMDWPASCQAPPGESGFGRLGNISFTERGENIKGGFFLPSYIRNECTIDIQDAKSGHADKAYGHHSLPRHGALSSDGVRRRIFSGPR